jgi:hypothetical protein
LTSPKFKVDPLTQGPRHLDVKRLRGFLGKVAWNRATDATIGCGQQGAVAVISEALVGPQAQIIETNHLAKGARAPATEPPD